MMPDLFTRPVFERRAEIPAGCVFLFGGRPLSVVRVYGTDAAAPVIVEELTGRYTLKGQLAIWSVDGVSRALRGRS
jgi:hypothetical protein